MISRWELVERINSVVDFQQQIRTWQLQSGKLWRRIWLISGIWFRLVNLCIEISGNDYYHQIHCYHRLNILVSALPQLLWMCLLELHAQRLFIQAPNKHCSVRFLLLQSLTAFAAYITLSRHPKPDCVYCHRTLRKTTYYLPNIYYLC